jgi:hypothetical protein
VEASAASSQSVFSPGRTTSGESSESGATPRGTAPLKAGDSCSEGGLLSPDSTVEASPSPTRHCAREPTQYEAMLARVLMTELRRYSTLLDVMLDGVRRLDAAVKVRENSVDFVAVGCVRTVEQHCIGIARADGWAHGHTLLGAYSVRAQLHCVPEQPSTVYERQQRSALDTVWPGPQQKAATGSGAAIVRGTH